MDDLSKFSYAVIGASADPEKYGHRVFKDLLDAGYDVIPVNPKGGELLGRRVWGSVREAAASGKRADVAVFVVPPAVGLGLLPEMAESGVRKLWFQPGSESEAIRAYCVEHGLDCVMDACIMIERKKDQPD